MWSLNHPPHPSQKPWHRLSAALVLISLLIEVAAARVDEPLQTAERVVLTPSPGTSEPAARSPPPAAGSACMEMLTGQLPMALLGRPTLTRSGQFASCAKRLPVGVAIAGGVDLSCAVCLKADFQQLLGLCCQDLWETVCVLSKGIY